MIFLFILLITVCHAQTPTRAPLPDKTDDAFQQECLSASNVYRTKHHSPNFVIDNNARAYSKSRCNLISQHPMLSYKHQGVNGYAYGENQFWFGGPKNAVASCQNAVDSWYNEIRFYNFSNPGFNHAAGHFTQLIWKKSIGLGCARCAGWGGKMFETYIVCNPHPPGNYPTQYQFETNVLRT